MIDVKATEAAVSFFNEAVELLEEYGWTRANEENPWYWWKNPRTPGICSIGAAYQKSLIFREEDQLVRAIMDE